MGAFLLDRDTTSARADYNTRIYRPLRNLGFRALWRVGGGRPIAFGLANVALYAAAAALVFLLFVRLTGDAFAAAVGAGLWTLMPVHVEAVAYASALGDQLSLVLELWALLLVLPVLRGEAGRDGLRVAASLGLMLGAMLAKEMAVTGAALVGLLALGAPPGRRRRALLVVAAHGALALGYLALRTSVVGRVGQEDVTARAVWRGLGEAPVLYAAYARLALAPLGHRAAYVVDVTAARTALAVAGLLGALGAAWGLDRRARRAGAADAGLTVALGWFLVSLLPVVHLVPLWADLADRFALVPSVGLVLAGAVLLARLPAARRRVAVTLAGAVALLYAAGTLVEQRQWRSDLALWQAAAEAEPRSSLARANLGTMLLRAGRPDLALGHLEAAEALGRTSAEVALHRAMALAALGRDAEAARAAEAAVGRDPALGRGWAVLGDLRRRQGDRPGAARALAEAERLAPAHLATRLLHAALLLDEGRAAEAAAAYARLAAAAPRDASLRHLEAKAHLVAGAHDAAAAAARACLALAPDEPTCACLLGRALAPTDAAAARAYLVRCPEGEGEGSGSGSSSGALGESPPARTSSDGP